MLFVPCPIIRNIGEEKRRNPNCRDPLSVDRKRYGNDWTNESGK
jgi:hypothetical protein